MQKLKEYLKSEHGRLTTIAQELGITPGAIAQWNRVPMDRIVQIERLTGIPRHELNPSLFKGYKRIGKIV